MSKYGEMETNSLDNATRQFMQQADPTKYVDWSDSGLKRIVRLRLITDPGFPYWDVSYCFGEMQDGTPVQVSLPFSQLPRKNFRKAIVEYAVKDGVFAKRLGILDAISTLV